MRWLHIGLRDLTITIRDRASLGILVGMPMLLIVILGSALGNLASNLGQTPVAIVNKDTGRVGAQITDGFYTDDQLTELFAARPMKSEIAARQLVASGELAGVLVVPRDLSEHLNVGRPTSVVVYTDPGREIVGTVFRSVTQSLATRVSAASVAARTSAYYVLRIPGDHPGIVGAAIGKAVAAASATEALSAVGVDQRTAEQGTELSQLSYYAGGMSVMFLMFGAMFGAFSLVRERDDWTLPRMLMTPSSRAQILGGKSFGVFLVGLVQFGVLYAFTNLMGVRWGDPLATALIALATIAAATGLALFIAAVAKSVRAVSGLAQLLIQFMAAIGGSFIAVSVFPAWLQPFHYLSVNGWAIDAILSTMRGGGVVEILPNLAALFAIAIGFFLVGAWRLRWE